MADNGQTRTRNKRAIIKDILPESAEAIPARAVKHWEGFVAEMRKADLTVGTHFQAGDESFQTDVLAYPVLTVLQLAQSRDHNKHMDSYSDPTKPVIHTVRGVNAELLQGVWSQRGEGATHYTLFERAVHALHNASLGEGEDELSLDDVHDMIENADEATVDAFKKKADVKTKIAELRVADAQARLAKAPQAAAAEKTGFATLLRKAQ